MEIYRNGPETERLLHRAFTAEDAPAFFALNGDPDVMRHTGEPALGSVDEARRVIEGYPDFETVGYGRWACVLRDTGEVIGFCGMKYLADLDVVDIGYRLLPRYWGRGLATEACGACLGFGFETMQLDTIVAYVLPENAASVNVLRKVGMRLDGTVRYDGLDVLRYSIERPDRC